MRNNQPVTDVELHFGEDEILSSTTDLKGRITSVSPAFVKLSGFAEQELIGQPHNIVRHPDMPAEAYEWMWRTISAGNTWSGLVKPLETRRFLLGGGQRLAGLYPRQNRWLPLSTF